MKDKLIKKPRPASAGTAREAGRKIKRDAAPAPRKGERIARRLARAGVASRREAEAMIAEGRVKVNGKRLTSPALNVLPSDRIEVDDRPLPPIERTRLFLFHKPAGLVTTSRDPQGRKTIFDILPEGLPRLISVGRLDMNTEGLLLLTNDGGLARVLELPSTAWMRRYRARVHGTVDPQRLAELEHGIAVDGIFYGAITATLDRQQGSNAWLTIGLREGKNREVRNVMGALDLDVTRLIRISYGPFQLGELPRGAVQEIRGRTLRDQLGERLIREAEANFDAPIAHPFSTKPTRSEKMPTIKSGSGLENLQELPEKKPKLYRKAREERRQELRDRLQTKPPAKRGGDKQQKNAASQGPRSRASHVWMAPGARPTGKSRKK